MLKRAVGEDPGPFILGDKDYYRASETGEYSLIYHTMGRFTRRGTRRIKKDGPEGPEEEEESSHSSSSDSSSTSSIWSGFSSSSSEE
jgi:hypothetical protein